MSISTYMYKLIRSASVAQLDAPSDETRRSRVQPMISLSKYLIQSKYGDLHVWSYLSENLNKSILLPIDVFRTVGWGQTV